jgi:DNA-binding NtrC family response regulator
MKSRADTTSGETTAPDTDRLPPPVDDELTTYVRPLREVEAEHVRFALRACNGNKKRAAEALGISRDTLYRKLADLEERLVQMSAHVAHATERTP